MLANRAVSCKKPYCREFISHLATSRWYADQARTRKYVGSTLSAKMVVEVSGTLRLLSTEGVWPIKRKKWRELPVRWTFDTNTGTLSTFHEVADHFKLAVDVEKDRVIVRARLRGVHFVLGECELEGERHINLSVQQVAKAEVRGDLYFRKRAGKAAG